MWNRRREIETSDPEPRNLAAPAPTAQRAPEPARDSDRPVPNGVPHTTTPAPPPPALIGAQLSIVGEVKTEQDLNVAGKVEGPVHCSDAALCVLADGHVRGNVHAREVVLFGTIEGDVCAKTRLIVRQDGRLIGNVSCAAIMIEETAYFKGSIDIVRNGNGH